MSISLTFLLKDSDYRLDQFRAEHIERLEAASWLKDSGKKPSAYVNCLVRGKRR